MNPHHPNSPGVMDPAAPRHQRYWDWRAAANFITGGCGGGLLLFAAAASFGAHDVRAMIFGGMVLIAAGLTCVWFEIGRPWRALNVFLHLRRSWMSREAAVAPLVFITGAAAVVTAQTIFVVLAGLFGAAFLYSQARMMAADRGIPAWRHPRCLPLLVATGLTEGAALLAGVSPALPRSVFAGVAVALLVLLFVRAVLWKRYLAGLETADVPERSVQAMAAIDRRFFVVGHLLPVVLVLAAVFGAPGAAGFMIAAGLLSAAAGWLLKYTLVTRAAFVARFALKHRPLRGGGMAAQLASAGGAAKGDEARPWRDAVSV